MERFRPTVRGDGNFDERVRHAPEDQVLRSTCRPDPAVHGTQPERFSFANKPKDTYEGGGRGRNHIEVKIVRATHPLESDRRAIERSLEEEGDGGDNNNT